MHKKLISVLILSIPERMEGFVKLYNDLMNQVDLFSLENKVEILALLDNKSQSIAEKRNTLLGSSKGSYVAFLDDDDKVSPSYLFELCEAITDNPEADCISFNQLCSINGKTLKVSFGLNNPHEGLIENEVDSYKNIKRPPYHMCAWKSIIAKSEKFRPVFSADGQSIEDIDWLSRLYTKSKTEFHLEQTLHYYIYNSEKTQSKFS